MSQDPQDEDSDIPEMGASRSGEMIDGETAAPRRRKLPIFRLAAAAGGLWALVALFPSFRYALQAGDPQDLGAAGSFTPGGEHHNIFARVTGTANREQAAQPQGLGYSYMALEEAGGALWVAVPVGEEPPAEGFVGRMVRFASADEWVQVRTFLKESVDTVTIDMTNEEFSASAAGTGAITLGPDDTVVIATSEQDVDVQFGKQGFKQADAQAIVAGLGYPFLAVPDQKGTVHEFVARVPADKREEVKKELRAHLPEGVSPAHPRLGATYVVRSEVYKAPGPDVKIEGGSVSFPFTEGGKVGRGYSLDGGALVERRVENGRLFVELSDVNRFRIERPLSIPDDAYVVYAGLTPSSRLPLALLWIAILAGLVAIPAVPFIRQQLKPKARAVEDVVE
jgi:hypothetical protein